MKDNILVENLFRGRLDKIIFSVIVSVVFLSPIFFIPFDFISSQFGTSLLFSFGILSSILLYVVMVLSGGFVSLPDKGKYIFSFLILPPLSYFVSWVVNSFSGSSFFGYTFDINTVGFIVISFPFIFLVSLVFNTKERIFYSYLFLLLSSVFVALFITSRLIFGADFLSFGVFNLITSTTIGSWNNVGIFFGIGSLLSLITFKLVNLSTLMKVLISIALFISLFFLAIVNYGVIWIILAVCSFLFYLYIVFSDDFSNSILKSFVLVPLYPILVFSVATIFIVFGNITGGYLQSKFNIVNVEIRPSFSSTFEIAKNKIKESPVFGSGPNTFINKWMIWKPNDVVSTIYWNLDFVNGIGLIPTFFVTTGLLGLVSWVLFLGSYLYIGFRSIFSFVEDKFIKYLVVSSFFVSAYLWIMSFYYVPSTVIFILTLFFTGLFFASLHVSGISTLKSKSFSVSPKTGFLASLVLVSIFMGSVFIGFGLFKNSKSLWYFQKSFHALNTLNKADLSESYMLRAIDLVPYDIYYRSLSEIELVRLNNLTNLDSKNIKTEEVQKQFGDILTNAIKAGQFAKEADPDNYLNWVSLGRVYEAVSSPNLNIKGAYENAEISYKEALQRNPKNPAILVTLSRLSASQNNLEKGRGYAIDAIKLKNNYLEAYFTLSQIEVDSGNIQEAISAVTASSVIDPTNPAVFFQLGFLKYIQGSFKEAIMSLEKATSMVKDYANAKYFLGLSYEAIGEHQKATKEFTDLSVTNPNNEGVKIILQNLKVGKPLFASTENPTPEKSKTLPVRERE